MKKTLLHVHVTALVLMLGSVGCQVGTKDAALAGLMDFVTGSVTDALGTAIPLTTWLGTIWGG